MAMASAPKTLNETLSEFSTMVRTRHNGDEFYGASMDWKPHTNRDGGVFQIVNLQLTFKRVPIPIGRICDHPHAVSALNGGHFCPDCNTEWGINKPTTAALILENEKLKSQVAHANDMMKSMARRIETNSKELEDLLATRDPTANIDVQRARNIADKVQMARRLESNLAADEIDRLKKEIIEVRDALYRATGGRP